MRKLLFFLFGFLAFRGIALATPEEWNYIPYSSYTEVATPGPILFTSATIQFVGVMIGSPSVNANGFISIFRSTSNVFTNNIATQTLFSTDYLSVNDGPIFIPLFEMKNTSFTYISKAGNAKVTYWIRCVPTPRNRLGICPGLPWNGSLDTKIEFP